MQVKSIAVRKHSEILSTFIKLPVQLSLRPLFCLFRVAVLHRFYCIIIDLTTLNGLIRNFNDIPIFTPYKMLVGHFSITSDYTLQDT